jgi:hypothetical protein
MATYHGASPNRFHLIRGVDRATGLHWLQHSARGAALAARRPESLSDLADLVVEASATEAAEMNKREGRVAPTNKQKEVSIMSEKPFDAYLFAKRVVADNLSAVSEQQATELIKKYADEHKLPHESSAAAFSRIYTGDDDVGLSFRKMIQIAKNLPHPHVGA